MDVSIFLADGTEECEALIVVDLLRRADIQVRTVAVDAAEGDTILSSHGVRIVCDTTIGEYEAAGEELLVIPGGKPGVDHLKANAKLSDVLRAAADTPTRLAAICAGPTVLGELGLLDGVHATVYPGCENALGAALHEDVPVHDDSGVVTGRALGSAIPFALHLVEVLRGKDAADEVAAAIVYQRPS